MSPASISASGAAAGDLQNHRDGVASRRRADRGARAQTRQRDRAFSDAGGFGTPEFEHAGRRRQVRVERAELVLRSGDGERRGPLTTLEDARRLVVELVPNGPLSAEPLDVDPAAAARVGDWYAFGAAILGELADATASPVRL